jgi:hypothetical protein
MIACVVLPRPDAALARRLFAVSPLLQREGALVFLDDRGLQRLHGGPAGLFAAIRRALAPETATGLALASNRFTAEVAARFLRRPVTVREGEEALFLSRLPLSALPLPPDLARRLLPLGLETLGDFASLPSAGIERRYGPAGVALHRLARGLDARGLLPEREPQELCVERQLDDPVDRLPLLLPALEEALSRLCPLLTEQGQGATRLALDLALDDVLPDDEARRPRRRRLPPRARGASSSRSPSRRIARRCCSTCCASSSSAIHPAPPWPRCGCRRPASRRWPGTRTRSSARWRATRAAAPRRSRASPRCSARAPSRRRACVARTASRSAGSCRRRGRRDRSATRRLRRSCCACCPCPRNSCPCWRAASSRASAAAATSCASSAPTARGA